MKCAKPCKRLAEIIHSFKELIDHFSKKIRIQKVKKDIQSQSGADTGFPVGGGANS